MLGGVNAVRVFKTKTFARFARKQSIDDPTLWQAIADGDTGLIEPT